MEVVQLKDVVVYRKNFIEIDDDQIYKRCRVQLHRRGVKQRDELLGSDIKTKKQRLCKKNDFIVAEMDAKFGGYGIVPKELEGAIVSSHYYLYELKPERLSFEFLDAIIDSGMLQEQIKAVGSTNYSRVSAKEVLEYEIPCPPLEKQKQIVSVYGKAKNRLTRLDHELTHQQTLLKKLRQQILQEAIEGKLTADWRAANPNVEPASELLKRIAIEKTELIKAKKIKKQKALPPISDDEKPFELPDGWSGARPEEVTLNKPYALGIGPFGSDLVVSDYRDSGIPLIFVKNITNNNFNMSLRFVSEDKSKQLKAHAVYPGYIVITKMGDPPGVATIYQNNGNGFGILTADCIKIGVHGLLNKEYILYSIQSAAIQSQLGTLTKGMGRKKLSLKRFKTIILPIPPFEEQQAIVTKVEALLAICDQLETQITQNQTHADALMQAVLREAFTQDSTEAANA